METTKTGIMLRSGTSGQAFIYVPVSSCSIVCWQHTVARNNEAAKGYQTLTCFPYFALSEFLGGKKFLTALLL